MDKTMKRWTCTLLLGGTLAFALVPAASAHDVVRKAHRAHNSYYTIHTAPAYPRWLRRDRDFQRWYVRSRYRYLRPMAWDRVYRIYRRDLAYHRHGRHYYPYRQWESTYSKQKRDTRYRRGD